MAKKVTQSNTKNEIIEAYQELLTHIEENKASEPRKEQEKQANNERVQSASGLSFDGIVKQMGNLKVQLSGSLDKLSENFISEYQKFADLQKAISIEKQNLEDLYELTAQTDSLAAMLQVQKQKKEQFDDEMAQAKQAFESEMAEKHMQWKKEQDAHNLAQKEYEENIKKTRKREEEEYAYNLSQQRKKEADAYNQKQEALVKELEQREAAIAEAENELKDLREKVQNFPNELEQAVKKAEQAITKTLTSQYEFEKQLNAKQLEGELKLNNQVITNLKEKIKDQEASIKELSVKAAAADAGVKDIALRALDTSKTRINESRKSED